LKAEEYQASFVRIDNGSKGKDTKGDSEKGIRTIGEDIVTTSGTVKGGGGAGKTHQNANY